MPRKLQYLDRILLAFWQALLLSSLQWKLCWLPFFLTHFESLNISETPFVWVVCSAVQVSKLPIPGITKTCPISNLAIKEERHVEGKSLHSVRFLDSSPHIFL